MGIHVKYAQTKLGVKLMYFIVMDKILDAVCIHLFT